MTGHPQARRSDSDDLYGDRHRVMGRVMAATVDLPYRESEEVPAMCVGALYYRELEDERCIAVYPLIMGTVRVVVGPTSFGAYDDAWCYATPLAGLLAAGCWDGNGDPPEGWFRNIRTARRRPEGDPEREYVAA